MTRLTRQCVLVPFIQSSQGPTAKMSNDEMADSATNGPLPKATPFSKWASTFAVRSSIKGDSKVVAGKFRRIGRGRKQRYGRRCPIWQLLVAPPDTLAFHYSQPV